MGLAVLGLDLGGDAHPPRARDTQLAFVEMEPSGLGAERQHQIAERGPPPARRLRRHAECRVEIGRHQGARAARVVFPRAFRQ